MTTDDPHGAAAELVRHKRRTMRVGSPGTYGRLAFRLLEDAEFFLEPVADRMGIEALTVENLVGTIAATDRLQEALGLVGESS